MMHPRLFIVSNRLPLTIEQAASGFTCRQSSGGLISAITAYLSHNGAGAFEGAIWAGVPGCTEDVWNDAMNHHAPLDYDYLPVFIDDADYDGYYNGFSNSLIWPLFHYFPSFAEYDTVFFDAYLKANSRFADELAAQLRKDDVVWIHDYHLLPLACMLRERFPTLTIGFFLHIPFPSYELFRVLPKGWQRAILKGMLGADLIGFHTIDYTQHFLSCVSEILKADQEGQYISWQNRKVKADAFPISIDFNLWNGAWADEVVTQKRAEFMAMKRQKKLLFSVDRLDYTKGVSNRLKGYERFLLDYPEYHGKVVFALIVVPSRDTVSKYAERKKMIDEYIGDINSRLGTITWQPVIYQYGHLSFEELVGMYTACDLALITPLRDGMNLVAKEFVASRKDGRGVLVLSEMAGAARELTEALLINPNDTLEIATRIAEGLSMPEAEQAERMAAMQGRIGSYDVNTWATDFFTQLHEVKDLQLEFEVKFLDAATRADLLRNYARADRRVLLLDYDGSLIPFSKLPALAKPGEALLARLKALADDERNDIYIISGRDGKTLEAWLGHLRIGLVAEHGAKIRRKDGHWESEALSDTAEWKVKIEKLMRQYVARCPHSFIEEKEFSLAWHYRNAEHQQGLIRARELHEALHDLTHGLQLNVLNGNKVLEVRARGVNKGIAANKILEPEQADFILAIGDDVTDEDMFIQLARMRKAYTIKVGPEASFAKYNLHNPAMVHSLLEEMGSYASAQA